MSGLMAGGGTCATARAAPTQYGGQSPSWYRAGVRPPWSPGTARTPRESTSALIEARPAT